MAAAVASNFFSLPNEGTFAAVKPVAQAKHSRDGIPGGAVPLDSPAHKAQLAVGEYSRALASENLTNPAEEIGSVIVPKELAADINEDFLVDKVRQEADHPATPADAASHARVAANYLQDSRRQDQNEGRREARAVVDVGARGAQGIRSGAGTPGRSRTTSAAPGSASPTPGAISGRDVSQTPMWSDAGGGRSATGTPLADRSATGTPGSDWWNTSDNVGPNEDTYADVKAVAQAKHSRDAPDGILLPGTAAAGKYAAALAAENATSVQFEQAAVKVPATLASTVDEDELVARVAGEAATADPDASVPAAEAAADLADSRAQDLERLRDTTASIGTQRVDRPATARLTTTRSGGVNQFGTPGRNVGGDFGANVGGSTWGNTGTNARGNDWSNTGAGTWGGAGGNTGGGTMGTSLATTDPAMAPNEDTFAEMKAVAQDKHSRDDVNNPQLPPGQVPTGSAASKAQSATSDYAKALAAEDLVNPNEELASTRVRRNLADFVDEDDLVERVRAEAGLAITTPASAGHMARAADKLAASRGQDVNWMQRNAQVA